MNQVHFDNQIIIRRYLHTITSTYCPGCTRVWIKLVWALGRWRVESSTASTTESHILDAPITKIITSITTTEFSTTTIIIIIISIIAIAT